MPEPFCRNKARRAQIAILPAPVLLAPGLLALALLAGALAPPAAAQKTETKELEAVEQAIEQDRGKAESAGRKAERLKLEIQALRAASIAAARKAQEHEARLSHIETRLDELQRQETATLANLQDRRGQLTGTLAALQRIALRPADALIIAPSSPLKMVRSAMLLRVAIPAIESRAAVLRGELDDLAKLGQRIALQRVELANTSEALEAERLRLGTLISRKSEARVAATAEQRAAQERAQRLAAQAKDLRDLLVRLEREAQQRAERKARELVERQTGERAERAARELAERQARERSEREARKLAGRQAQERSEREARELAERQAREQAEREAPAPEPATRLALARPDNIRPFPDAQASLRIPARGRVVLRYGQSRGDAGGSKGIRIRARDGAQVVAPYDGQVVYAGPFRRYGQILIIEHGGRYHTLLAGLDQVHAVVGQWVLAGEPVGILSSPGNGRPELYFELRRAGQPINPLPWLATTGDKVRG